MNWRRARRLHSCIRGHRGSGSGGYGGMTACDQTATNSGVIRKRVVGFHWHRQRWNEGRRGYLSSRGIVISGSEGWGGKNEKKSTEVKSGLYRT